MEINGTIYKILPQEEVTLSDGTKKNKGGFVIMREDEYPKPVAFELFGEERLALLTGFTVGMPVRVSFFAESFESRNGSYFTSMRCFHISQMTAPSTMPPAQSHTAPAMGPWNPTGNTTTPQSPHKLPQDDVFPLDQGDFLF